VTGKGIKDSKEKESNEETTWGGFHAFMTKSRTLGGTSKKFRERGVNSGGGLRMNFNL